MRRRLSRSAGARSKMIIPMNIQKAITKKLTLKDTMPYELSDPAENVKPNHDVHVVFTKDALVVEIVAQNQLENEEHS